MGLTKKGLFLLILALLITTAYAAAPEPTQLSYNPSPAVPGTTITIFLQIENNSSYEQKEVKVRIDDNYPFSVKGEREKNLGTIGAYGKTLVQFTVYVDPSAENRTYSLPVLTNSNNDTTWTQRGMQIIVSGKEPLLKVIQISDYLLAPGQEKELTLLIQNVGTSAAYDVIVEMQEDRTVTATGSVVERDITPLGSATAHIEKINPTEKQSATIKLNVNVSAALKNYTLPVTVSYRNSSGTRTSTTSYIGFKVSGNVNIDAVLKNTLPFVAGSSTEATIELFNKGQGKSEFTIVEIRIAGGTIDQPKQFIGTLAPDDVDSFKAIITFDKELQTGDKNLLVTLHYMDTDATQKTAAIILPIKVYSAIEGATLTAQGPSPVIILIIIVIILFVAWKAYKKVKKKK